MGDKYFSEIVNIDDEIKKYGNALCYVCGTGSGKSYWVKNVLTSKGKILFITSRRSKVDEDLEDGRFINNTIEYLNSMASKQLLLTNHQLANFIKQSRSSHTDSENQMDVFEYFVSFFDYIVVDEVHSIISDSTFSNDVFILKKYIEYTAFRKKIPTILLSATIEYLKEYLKDNKWVIRDFSEKCKFVVPKSLWFISSKHFETNFKEILPKNYKFIYYSNSATRIIDSLYLDFKDKLSAENIAVILSDTRQKEFYKKHREAEMICEKAIESLKKELMLPSETKLLLTTSKLKEGVNINNEDIEFVITESHNISDNIQYMGRIRNGLKVFCVISDAEQHNSNLNDLEYDYCIKEQINACNKYYKLCEEKDRNDFISFIEEKNQYIRFNYIDHKFDIYDLKYKMQYIMTNQTPKNWRNDLQTFCDKHKIVIYKFDKAQSYNAQESISNLIGKGLYGNEKTLALDTLKKAFGIKGKTVKKINEELSQKGIKYELQETRGKGENRDKRGFMIIKSKISKF